MMTVVTAGAPLRRLVHSALAVLLLSTWSSGSSDPLETVEVGRGSSEPLEFTVEVFPVTEEAPAGSTQPEPTQKPVELSSVTVERTTTTRAPTTESSTTSTAAPTSTTTATTTTSTTTTTLPETTTRETTPTTTTSTTTPTTTPTSTASTTEDPGHCPADLYCEGNSFPEQFYISTHKVICDQDPIVSQQCCLPQGKHLVCYNIMVDGEFLTFAPDRPTVSTDYMELCDLLLLSQNKTAGPYSTISKVKGPGRVAYRYREWVTLDPTIYRIKDIACMINPEVKRKTVKTSMKEEGKENKIRKENVTTEEEQNKPDGGD